MEALLHLFGSPTIIQSCKSLNDTLASEHRDAVLTMIRWHHRKKRAFRSISPQAVQINSSPTFGSSGRLLKDPSPTLPRCAPHMRSTRVELFNSLHQQIVYQTNSSTILLIGFVKFTNYFQIKVKNYQILWCSTKA